jgi:SagB-type dehydrogenase family enzyme
MEYHEGTKHSYASIRTNMHFLDWQNKPREFKVYPDIPTTPLPRDFERPNMPTLEAVAGEVDPRGQRRGLAISDLAALLYFSGGLTKKAVLGNGEEFYFRAAACAGALYPIEFYVVVGQVEGLDPGVYHFSPLDFGLRRLRERDLRGVLAQASGDARVAEASAIIALTAITWRSAWKYQARSYRYHFWDAGTILANLLATCTALGEEARVVLGFADGVLNQLLGVDGQREISLALIPLGRGTAPPPPAGPLEPIQPRVAPLSPREVHYPLITRMHEASALGSGDEAAGWRGRLEPLEPPATAGPRFPLPPPQPAARGSPLGDAILRRGSTRFFSHDAVTLPQLSAILERSTRGITADFLGRGGSSLIDTYLIINAVTGVPPGSYFFSPRQGSLAQLREGKFRGEAGYLCLEQDLGADAAATIFFLAPLHAVLERFGNRCYRAAELEAAIVGGRMYLAAYSLGLGATGLTFYDDDVVDFFSPHAAGKDAMFVVALGRAAPGRSSRSQPLPMAKPRDRGPRRHRGG